MNLLRNLFALFGLAVLVVAVLLYVRGARELDDFDPRAAQSAAAFLHRALDSDVVTAGLIRVAVDEGVTPGQAAKALKRRAGELDVKVAGRIALHKRLGEQDREAFPHLEIFDLCDASTLATLARFNPDLTPYLPCRIILGRDGEGRAWLAAVDLDMLVHGTRGADPALQQQVLGIRDRLLDVMTAAAAGGKPAAPRGTGPTEDGADTTTPGPEAGNTKAGSSQAPAETQKSPAAQPGG